MEFLSVINSIGTIPLLVLIVVIFILLFREVKKDNQDTKNSLSIHKREMAENLAEYKRETAESLAEYKTLVDKQLAAEEKVLKELDLRLRTVETDYAKKTDVQEALSGWRMEIRHLSDKIDKVLLRK